MFSVETAVAVGVFVDGDLVGPAHVIRRGDRHLVVHGPPPFVFADEFQPGRIGILQILHDPHPPALVEVQEDRLFDLRLGEHQFELKIIGHLEPGGRFGRRQRAVGLCEGAISGTPRNRRKKNERSEHTLSGRYLSHSNAILILPGIQSSHYYGFRFNAESLRPTNCNERDSAITCNPFASGKLKHRYAQMNADKFALLS
jgi:hypothetical protein